MKVSRGQQLTRGRMAAGGGLKSVIILLALVMSSLWLAAADSTIQNVSSVDMKVNGKTLKRGQIVTIPIAKGKTGAFISVSFVATIGNIQIKNSRQYFVVDNQFNTVDYGNGKKDKLLDVMEGRLVANSF